MGSQFRVWHGNVTVKDAKIKTNQQRRSGLSLVCVGSCDGSEQCLVKMICRKCC